MIKKIEITDNKFTSVGYISKIPAFENGSVFEFKPGVNVIVGPNGSGKSTLLRLIQDYTLCNENHYTRLPDALGFPDLFNKEGEVKDGIKIYHDYLGIVFRLRQADELKENEAWLEDISSFALFLNGKNSSTGEKLLLSIHQLFNSFTALKKDEYKFPLKKLEEAKVNKLWTERFHNLVDYYRSCQFFYENIEEFQYTVLMDEPDRNLDIENLEQVYGVVSSKRPNTQLITVLHNQALLYRLSKLEYINFVEFEKGYLERVCDFVEGSMGCHE